MLRKGALPFNVKEQILAHVAALRLEARKRKQAELDDVTALSSGESARTDQLKARRFGKQDRLDLMAQIKGQNEVVSRLNKDLEVLRRDTTCSRTWNPTVGSREDAACG